MMPSGACLLDRLDTIMHLPAAPLQQEGKDAVRGTVSLAMPAEVAPLLVPPLIAAFHATCPHVTLDVQEAASGTLEAWLLSSQFYWWGCMSIVGFNCISVRSMASAALSRTAVGSHVPSMNCRRRPSTRLIENR
jgi:hypothetical protein